MGLLAFTAAGLHGRVATPTDAHPGDARVERGRYLVAIAGCNDCHTLLKMRTHGPEPDMTRQLSGHPEELVMPTPPRLPPGAGRWSAAETNTAFAESWGASYAPNLTPDPATGLGVWTEEIFVKTVRSGRHWEQGRPILPPMPWQNLPRMSDDDLAAVYVYLRTLPPIHNRVLESVPADPAAPGS